MLSRPGSSEYATRWRLYQTLLLTVFLALAVILVIAIRYSKVEKEEIACWEDSMGQDMYRLLLLFFFAMVILSFGLETVYKLIQPW